MLTLALLVIGVDGVNAAETKIHECDYTEKTSYPFYRMDEPTGSSFDVSEGLLVISNTVEQTNNYDLQPFVDDGITTIEGYDYIVRFTLKCTAAGSLICNMGTWSSNKSASFDVTATDDFVTKEVSLTDFPVSATNVHVLLQSGKFVGTIYLKKVEVYRVVPDVPTKTVRNYLRPTDTNFIEYFPWNPSESRRTVNGSTVFLSANDGGGNTANGWDMNSNKKLGNYKRLVVNISERFNTDNINVIIGEEGYWNAAKLYTIHLTSGQTQAEFDLENLLTQEGVTRGADCTGIAANINMICIVTESHQEAMSFTLGEVYLEKEVERDFTTEPFDINNLTVPEEMTFDAETQTISFSEASWSNNVSWFYSPAQDWSGYHYFVMVPQKKWSELGFAENYRIKIDSYYMNENVEEGADIDCWYQTWAQRANIVDIETKLPYPKYNVTRLSMFCTDQPISFQFAAFYLTNTRPANDGDYVRAIATADTWGTLCLPYHFALCGAVAYDVVGVDSKDSPSKLYLEPKYGVLEAGKAYLFKTNSTDGLRAYRAGEEEVASPGTGYLHGTFVGATVPNDGYSYILKNGVWKKSTSGITNTVAANRAYLTITDNLVVPVSAAKEKGWLTWDMENGDLTTGINNISDNTDKEVQTGIYDILGRRMDNSTKLHSGLYIINGKKVFVK